MAITQKSDPVVIGVGNSFRGDDAIGLLVIQRLWLLPPEGVQLEECEGEGTRLLDLWKGAGLVIVIDAVCSGRPPGTLHCFDATSQPLPANLFQATSTHNVGVAEAIELGRVLNCLPARLLVYGIEGQQFELGCPPLPEVAAAVEPVLKRLKSDLARFGNTRNTPSEEVNSEEAYSAGRLI